MKKSLVLLFVLAMANFLLATPKGFSDDLDAAISTTNKPVFAVFSGSDWCYWCKVLDKDYLSQKEFVEEASKTFTLVYVDSPRDESRLTIKGRTRNPKLLEEFKIRGFPTVLFIDAKRNAVAAPRPVKGISPKLYAEELVKAARKKKVIK